MDHNDHLWNQLNRSRPQRDRHLLEGPNGRDARQRVLRALLEFQQYYEGLAVAYPVRAVADPFWSLVLDRSERTSRGSFDLVCMLGHGIRTQHHESSRVMVLEHEHEYPSQWKEVESIAEKIGVNHETLRQWVKRAEVDAGRRPGTTREEKAKIRDLEREVKEHRRANEIL